MTIDEMLDEMLAGVVLDLFPPATFAAVKKLLSEKNGKLYVKCQQFPAISLPPEKRSLLTFLFVNAAGTISALSPHLIARANGVAGHVFLH
ncbi:MAG: hypothetical protein EXR98_23945, partial [Gemmataceae bacterium]|nr:hypothetical protein [Gemmataceae bacterium]